MVPIEQTWQAKYQVERDRTELLADELLREREDYRRFQEATGEWKARVDAEHDQERRAWAGAIAVRDARLHRLGWAEALLEGRALLLALAVTLADRARWPRVRRVGRRDRADELAAVSGVLIAFAIVALFGLLGVW